MFSISKTFNEFVVIFLKSTSKIRKIFKIALYTLTYRSIKILTSPQFFSQ